MERKLSLTCGALLLGTLAAPVFLRAGEAAPEPPQFTAEEDASFDRGARTFEQLCSTCHGPDAKGNPIPDDPDGRRMAPPLAGSKRITGRSEYPITALLYGVTGPVDEENFEGLMIPMESYGDAWIADVTSFVRNSFGNSASMITSNQVSRIRARIGERGEAFTVPQILSMLPTAATNPAAWKVTASVNSDRAATVVDSASPSAWRSDEPQAAGMWLQIELPETVAIVEIALDSAVAGGSPAGFPRGYQVQTSNDGNAWSNPIAEGKGRGANTVISFDPVKAKFLRVSLTASDAAPWSVGKIQLLQAGLDAPAATGIRTTNKFE